MTDIINGPIVEGCFVRLRDGTEIGPVSPSDDSNHWVCGMLCWWGFKGRRYHLHEDVSDIIEVLPARSADPAEPSYEQKLWDKVAKDSLKALIGKSKFFDREGENGAPLTKDALEQFRYDLSASAMQYADAFMAERAKRMKL